MLRLFHSGLLIWFGLAAMDVGQPVIAASTDAIPTVKWQPTVRVQPLASLASRSHSSAFKTSLLMLRRERFAAAPRVVASSTGEHYMTPAARIVLNAPLVEPASVAQVEETETWSVWRVVQHVTRDEQPIVVVRKVATAVVDDENRQIMQLEMQQQEVRAGDLLLPNADIPSEHSTFLTPSAATIVSPEDISEEKTRRITLLDGANERHLLNQGESVLLYQSSGRSMQTGERLPLWEVNRQNDPALPSPRRLGSVVLTQVEGRFGLAQIIDSFAPLRTTSVVVGSALNE